MAAQSLYCARCCKHVGDIVSELQSPYMLRKRRPAEHFFPSQLQNIEARRNLAIKINLTSIMADAYNSGVPHTTQGIWKGILSVDAVFYTYVARLLAKYPNHRLVNVACVDLVETRRSRCKSLSTRTVLKNINQFVSGIFENVPPLDCNPSKISYHDLLVEGFLVKYYKPRSPSEDRRNVYAQKYLEFSRGRQELRKTSTQDLYRMLRTQRQKQGLRPFLL